MQLDAVDLRIFEAVQRDGRITKVVLVEEVGLSPTPLLDAAAQAGKGRQRFGFHACVTVRRLAPVTSV